MDPQSFRRHAAQRKKERPPSGRNRIMTALWILFSAFCGAGILACIQCLGKTLAFVDIAFLEFAFVLAVTILVMFARRTPFRTPVWRHHLLRAALGIGVVFTQIITATNMPVASAQTLQYTSPLFVAGFVSISALRNHEHVDWRILAAILTAFAGICIMFHPSARTFSSAYVPIGLLCGLFTAASILMLKELASLGEPVARTFFYFNLHGTIFLAFWNSRTADCQCNFCFRRRSFLCCCS